MMRLQTRAAPADAAPTAGRRQLRLLPSGSGRARGGGLPGSGASDGRRWLVLAVATAIGLILTGSAVFLAYSFDAQLAHVQFGALAESRRLEAQEGLTDREQMMQAICGLVEFSKPGIGRAAFNALIDELLPPSYGVDSVSWIPRVPGGERAAFEREAARAGLAGDRITALAGGAPVAAGDRQEYFPILYTAGPQSIPASPGIDIGSDAIREAMLERARDSGGIAASPIVEVPTDRGRRRAVYLLAPVYRRDRPRDTVASWRRSLAGFVQFVIDPGATLRAIHAGITSPQGLDFYFFQTGAGPRTLPFYVGSSFLDAAPAPLLPRAAVESGMHATKHLTIGDARWTMVAVPLADGPLSTGYGRSWIVLAAGLFVTGLVTAYIGAAIRHTERLQNLLGELRRRDAILDAVTTAAAKLAGEPSLAKAVPAALRIAAEAVGADRALVLEAAPASDGGSPSALRYAWQAPDVPIKVEPAYFAGLPPDPPDLAARLAPLRTGQVVAAGFSGAGGGLRDLLGRLKIRSLLLVAIVVKGRYWGHIGFHDCRREREWSAAETGALKTLAELVGSVIERARYVDALADADAIVRNSPTFLFRLRGETPAPLTYVSPNVSRIIGYDAARLLAQPTFYRTLVHPDDRATVDEALRGLIEADAGPAVFAFRVRVADGAYRWFENRATAHRDEGGGHLVIEGLMSDVTERRAAERKIAELARTDPLTGLANRTSFRDRLGLAFAAARRGAPGFAVLCLDLDHFKDVNDTLGHPAGDKLLQAVAERIAGSLRETDLAARFGGDEFVVLQTDVTDPSVAGALAQRIRGNLAASVAIDGSAVHIAASVGIALYTAEVRAPEDLLEQADRALYRAKEDGRGRYRFHSEKLDAVVHEQIAMAGELRTAIAGGQLEIYYQPQVAVQSGAVVGMEALVRWNHPQRGLLEPAAFLPAAERAGMIVPLGKWVLEHACRQLRLWRDEGLTPPVMAVNLSGAQLKLGREFERDVVAVLEKWRLSPGDLEFDVSESVLLDATRGHPDALAALRQLGVGIAIDDFGSDYTAIGRLRASHVKRFKIAPQLVEAMTRSPDAAAVVRAMMGLARQLDIEIVAEGVETEAQCAFLLAENAAAAQGFLFGRPVPAQQAGELLRQGAIRPPGAGIAA